VGPPRPSLRGIGEGDLDEPIPQDYYQAPSEWSRDGRFIAYTNTAFAIDNELNGEVWLIDMARNRKVIHLINT
jgi:hypothetical protein